MSIVCVCRRVPRADACQTPRSLCFVALDVSHSMAAVQPVVTGVHPAQSIDMHAPVELAKDWIRTKYGQRVRRSSAPAPAPG